MKSGISCFKTALKKDLSRFAPAWILLYTICLLLGLLLMADGPTTLGLPRAFAFCIQLMGIVNLGYALLTSQLLFGDLFQSRLCFGLHTLPLRREGWFAAHVLAGLLFSLVPSAVMAAAAIPMLLSSAMENGWQLPLYWLLATNLQYLFFFGVGVFSMLCSGNRLGSGLVYGICNFGAILAYYVVDTIYTPMLYGIVTREDAFTAFSPVAQMVDLPFIQTNMTQLTMAPGAEPVWHGTFALTDNWWYLCFCAGVGLALMALALLLYRRRDLERSGDLMATRYFDPVFLILYCLTCVTVFQLCYMLFLGYRRNYYSMLFIGLAVGWFTGQMLLRRSSRVFRPKFWLGFAAMAAALGLSLGLTHMDVLGLETRVPDRSQVASVTITQGIHTQPEYLQELTAREDIENAIDIHEAALGSRLEGEALWYRGRQVSGGELPEDVDWSQVRRSAPVTLRYQLKNGTTLTRSYYIWSHQEEGLLLRHYLSSLRAVTGLDQLTWGEVDFFSLNGYEVPQQYWAQPEVEALLAAVEADCRLGLLAQDPNLHPLDYVMEYTVDGEIRGSHSFWLYVGMGEKTIRLNVYADSENVMQWLRQRGLVDWLRQLEQG